MAVGMRERWKGACRWLGRAAAATLLMAAADADARTVGLAMSGTDAFQRRLRDGLEAHARALGDVELRIEDAGGDADRQNATMARLAAAGVDAIIVTAVDGEDGVVLSTVASRAGIPLVFLAVAPIHVDALPARQAYVGSDEGESGSLQSREVCRILGGQGRVAVLMGELQEAAARTRTETVERVFAGRDCSGIQIVERQSANGSREQAEALVREWLAAGDDLNAVIANDDEMALGAIEGLKAGAAWTDDMIVAGIDATRDGLAAVKSGDMQVTVRRDVAALGVVALDTALKLAAGGSVPPKSFVPFELVTAVNVEDFLAH